MRERSIQQDLKHIANIPEGKRALGNIFYLCRLTDTSLDMNSATNTAYMEGMRYVGLQIQNAIGLSKSAECMEAFLKFEQLFEEGAEQYGERRAEDANTN